jgi:hypothetical protein
MAPMLSSRAVTVRVERGHVDAVLEVRGAEENLPERQTGDLEEPLQIGRGRGVLVPRAEPLALPDLDLGVADGDQKWLCFLWRAA